MIASVIPDLDRLLSFAVVWIAMYTGHQVGDHWAQTSHQAGTKGCKSHAGRMACLAHVASVGLARGRAGFWSVLPQASPPVVDRIAERQVSWTAVA